MSTNSGPEDWSQQQQPAGAGYPPPPPLDPRESAPLAVPKSLETSVKLWLVAAGLSIVHIILSLVNKDEFIDAYSARLGVSLEAARTSAVGIGSVIFQVALIALWVFFVYQMRSGQNWARIVLTVIGAIVVLLGTLGFLAAGVYFSLGVLGVLEVLLSIASLLVMIGAIAFQFKADTNPYFARS